MSKLKKVVKKDTPSDEITEEESKVISTKDAAIALIKEYQGNMLRDKQQLARHNKAVNDLNISIISADGAIRGLQKLLEEKK